MLLNVKCDVIWYRSSLKIIIVICPQLVTLVIGNISTEKMDLLGHTCACPQVRYLLFRITSNALWLLLKQFFLQGGNCFRSI